MVGVAVAVGVGVVLNKNKIMQTKRIAALALLLMTGAVVAQYQNGAYMKCTAHFNYILDNTMLAYGEADFANQYGIQNVSTGWASPVYLPGEIGPTVVTKGKSRWNYGSFWLFTPEPNQQYTHWLDSTATMLLPVDADPHIVYAPYRESFNCEVFNFGSIVILVETQIWASNGLYWFQAVEYWDHPWPIADQEIWRTGAGQFSFEAVEVTP